MISILIEGREAVLADGSSFEFVRENPEFSDSDGYTLTIEFPMVDCPENVAVFGHLQRMDTEKSTVLMGAVISSGRFFARGALAVTEVTECVVKGQFLEGVDPEHEELDIDRLFVNEMDLGGYPFTECSQITPQAARAGTGEEVCYPWLPIGYDVINCRAVDRLHWHEESVRLAWQPYLLVILRRMAAEAGYSCDFHRLEETLWRRALVCNTLPPTWGITGYARALPHWTVREFFTKMGLTMKGTFVFDESLKCVTFSFYEDAEGRRPEVVLDDVADVYQSTVNRDEKDAGYLPVRRYRYRDQDETVWKYLTYPLVNNGSVDVAEFDSWGDYEASLSVGDDGHRRGPGSSFIRIREYDTVFVPRSYWLYSEGHVSDELAEKYRFAKVTEWQPCGVFAPPGYDPDESYEDLDVVPVVVDYALEGKCMWLPVAGADEGSGSLGSGEFDFSSSGADGIRLTASVQLMDRISASKSRVEALVESYADDSSKPEYFSVVYIGFEKLVSRNWAYPLTDVDVYAEEFDAEFKGMLRLNGAGDSGVVDPCVKYVYDFVSDDVPDLSSRFFIRGQEYVASKITATFDGSGIHRVMRGEFYRVRLGLR